ncbi:DUF3054 domain-containing protein [Natrialbaceae archaeon A-CW3]
MTETLTSLRTDPPDRTRVLSTAAILLGDALIVIAFIGVGLLSHSIEPWVYPDHLLRTSMPFLLAWLVVAPILGLFDPRTLSSYRRTLGLITLGWIAASILGGLIRATSYFPGGAPIDFILVNIGFGLLFVLPWRLLVTALVRRRS